MTGALSLQYNQPHAKELSEVSCHSGGVSVSGFRNEGLEDV